MSCMESHSIWKAKFFNYFKIRYPFFSVQEFEEAMKLSEEDFKSKYNFEKPVNDPSLVIYCRSGRRVGMTQEILSKNGFDKHR